MTARLPPSIPPWRWLWHLLLAGFVLRVGLGLSADWFYRADEYIQYLEQAHRVVFGYGHIPWEYRLGARNWMISAPAIAVLFLCKAVGLGHPDYYVPAMIVANSALSMLLPLGMYFFMRRQYNETVGRAALLCGILWYELIIFASRALSEHYAAILIIAALGLASPRAGVARALSGGFLLGLALSLRAPYAPVVGIAGLAWLFVLPGRGRAALVGGGFAALLLWGAVDALTWGGWWSSLRNYIIVIAETPDEVWGQTGLFQRSKTEFAYLKYLAACSFGIFPAVFIAACLAFRAHRFLLLLIGGGLLVHLPYVGAQYSNIFVIIPLWLCLVAALFGELAARRRAWAAPVLTAATLITLAGYFAMLPFTENVNRVYSRYFFFQSPFSAASQFLSRQEDVRAVMYTCGSPYSGGGYYRLHHNVPALSLRFPDHVRLVKQSGRPLTDIVSHLITCESERINGFSEVFYSDIVHVYANDNPAGVKPLAGFVYDIYPSSWAQIEDYVIEQGLISDPRPPTPFAPDLE